MTTIELEKAIQQEIKQIPEEHLEEVLKLLQTFRQQKKPNRVLGLFKNDTELIDEIVKEAMADREKQVLRLYDNE